MKNFGKDRPWRTDMVRAIVVCDGVTSLGNNVARDCDRLLTVELPSSLTSIGENAFLNCVNLSEIRLPLWRRDDWQASICKLQDFY